eukprot:SAG22_NODE_2212_length_2831_cov_2.290996_1_plen_646_part_10
MPSPGTMGASDADATGAARGVAPAPAALLASPDKAQRERAYAGIAVLASAAGEAVTASVLSAAKDCVVALVGSVLCADAEVVGSAEARRASLLLGRLMMLDRAVVTVEWLREDRCFAAWQPSSSALAAVVGKEGPLTHDDLLLASSNLVPDLVKWSQSMTDLTEHDGLDALTHFSSWISSCPWHKEHPAGRTDAQNEPILLQAMALARTPPADVSELELAWVWWLIFTLISPNRPGLCAVAGKAGLLALGVQELHRSGSPVEWMRWDTPTGLKAGAIATGTLQLVISGALGFGEEVVTLVIESGVPEALTKMVQSFELSGASKVPEANVMGILHFMIIVQSIDLTVPEAAPIVALLRGIPSALKFCLAHPLNHIKPIALDTVPMCAMICAVIFGKDEEGSDFHFSQSDINSVVVVLKDILSGALVAWFPELPGHWFLPMLHLCVSDVNKFMLVRSAELKPLLLAALFLDPDHLRKDADVSMKAPIQAAAAAAILQIAVFDPGRALLEASPPMMAALRAVATEGGALTEACRRSAQSALVAIDRKQPAAARGGSIVGDSGGDDGGGHVMLSYQWDVQDVARRIVDELQARGYTTWFDLDNLQGSTVDGMSEAVDNASVMLSCISAKYKESAVSPTILRPLIPASYG